MANNEKLKQIVSNLQILTDLTNSMIDTEIYPVSFFSQAFDLIQKTQNDIHLLEADQVEMFATQMKKHQALILSIHQQMRNISPEKDVQEQPIPSHISNTVQRPPNKPKKQNVIEKTKITVTDDQDQKKKTSFFSRLGISKAEKNEEIKKTAVPIIEAPVKITAKEGAQRAPAEQPVKPVQIVAPAPVETAVPPPVMAKTVVPPPTHEKTVVQMPITEKTEIPTPAPPIAKATIESAPTEPKSPQSLNEPIEKKRLSDLRKAFSLNDRFLYRKELFAGNEDAMNKAISILNSKESFKESITFLEDKLHWDFSNPTVKNFVKILEIRFL